MKTINPLAILTLLTCSAWAEPASSTAGDTAWKQLLVGNARFVAGKAEHPNQSVKRRTEVAAGQKPFAVLIACADSWVGVAAGDALENAIQQNVRDVAVQ